ncbi:MAG: PAS domain-containing protein, partial [Chloroflexota bacterium]
VQSLSGHAAISIGNAYLLEQRKQQINVLTSLRELSLEALSEVDADAIVAAVLRTSLVLLHASEAALYRHEDDTHEIALLQAVRTENGAIDTFEPALPMEMLHQAHLKGTLQVIPDVHKDELYERMNGHLSTLKHQSALVVPIARRQRIEELLYIGFDEPRQFSHDDLDTVDLLAAQVGSHLENAALNMAITQQNDRTRAILDSTRDGIILLDTDNLIQDANSAAVALTGIDLGACIHFPLSIITEKAVAESAEAWQQLITMYEESPDEMNGEQFVIPQADNSVLVLLTLVTPVIDEHNITVGHLLTLRDITKEKELKEFRDTMQSMVLHDLRGPLTAIVTSMYVAESVISMHEGELDETLSETVTVSLASAEDMLRQVDTLRDLPMMNKLRVTPELTTVYEIAERAYKALQANFTG